MKPKFLLCLVLVLSCAFHCSPIVADANGAAINAPPSEAQIYRNENLGFQFTVPRGWTVSETNFEVFHYNEVFLTINNRRPNLTIQEQPVGPNEIEFNDHIIVRQLQPGEAYLSIGYFDGPDGPTMRSDTVANDLLPLLRTNRLAASTERDLSELVLGFFKRGHLWNISAYLREPITAATSNEVMAILESFRFVDAPVHNAAWAESLAWEELPKNLRAFGYWPVADSAGENPGYGHDSVLVGQSGREYSVQFSLIGLGTWRYSVSPDGKVQSEPAVVHAVSVPPSQLPSDLPGEKKAKVNAYWVAPFVLASTESGKTTLTWLAKDGSVKRHAAVNMGDQTGCCEALLSNKWVVQGINEDWRIVPHPVAPGPFGGYAMATPDSRVFFDEFSPKPGLVSLDIYIHGQRVNTVGPFLPCSPSTEVALNDDGGAALLVWKDESRSDTEIIALNTNGTVRFQTDCGGAVCSPSVAPGGVGVLLRPNTGTNQNSFLWFTKAGEMRSMDIKPNPECVGWIPQSCESLFLTRLGYETAHFELIDWNAGRRLWDIPCPGGGEVLAVGLTSNLVVFSVAEPYPAGTWQNANESLLQSGNEWVRTFYAANAQDGKVVARWKGQFPHTYLDASREHFLRLGNKLFYVAADEFTELNLEDILSKRNGWK